MMKSMFFLVLTITLVSSARILDETDANSPSSAAAGAPGAPGTGFSGFSGAASGFGPIGATGTGGSGTNSGFGGAGTAGGISASGAGVTGASGTNGGVGGGVTNGAGATGGVGASGAAGAVVGSGNELTFFMHDILGGTNPTAKLITGIVNNPAINGQIPFAKPNGAVLSVDNGVPTDSSNNAIINNNNLPFLTGLGGTTSNIIQNTNGNNLGGSNNLPIVDGSQVSSSTIQKLMFGTMTVIDDELTEGHELGSGLVGRAQGFYVASSVDGTSSTIAFTALFHGGGYVDSLSFFGIHRTAVSENMLAVMGGTGKYVGAQGFATVKTHPATASSQHTDGLETLLEFTVYLSY
uniref:Dirigent protein n=1 Tax=Kalanchoe fedtschenkoi TaxID=63787 RepID=A0A7N0ULP0_KALFE